MKVQTKFDIGDKIFHLSGGNNHRPHYAVGPYTVENIKIKIGADSLDPTIIYGGVQTWTDGCGMEQMSYESHLRQDNCFSTEQEATQVAKDHWNTRLESMKVK